MKGIIFCVYVCSTIVYAEPSVYGNTNQLNTVNTKAIASLKRQVAKQKERISGLTSVIEGLSATVNRLEQSSRKSSQSGENTNSNKVLQELAMMIDEINEKYVSKDDLENVLATDGKISKVKINKFETNKIAKNKSIINEIKTKKNNNLDTKSTAKVYSEGVRFFVKQRYDEANKRFTLTDVKGYKPAASNYYLGEIAYYTKKYEDAIFYFKKSAGLYDKASYIDVLLLHTAISLEKTGEKAQARAFYDNIIENYKDKKTANIARKKLEKL
jgi:TolA-binding protein